MIFYLLYAIIGGITRFGQCRICYENGHFFLGLVSPCKCKGSCKYVHHSCLKTTILYSGCTFCQVCREPYDMHKIARRDHRTVLLAVDIFIRLMLSYYTVMRSVIRANTLGYFGLSPFAFCGSILIIVDIASSVIGYKTMKNGGIQSRILVDSLSKFMLCDLLCIITVSWASVMDESDDINLSEVTSFSNITTISRNNEYKYSLP